MKSVLKVLPLILFTAIPASAQDPELRREAVQLLERANGVSLSPKLPNLERVDTFRVFDSSSGPQEGTFTRVVVQGTGRREESRFGEYHSLDIWAGGHLATVRSSELPPAEINAVMRLTPIYLLRFADDDVIHAIVDKAAVGKKIWCIEFDTIRGQKIENNGKVHEAVVQSAERPDLGAEALALVQQWVFTPAVCDGNPNTQEATFIVHFHGR